MPFPPEAVPKLDRVTVHVDDEAIASPGRAEAKVTWNWAALTDVWILHDGIAVVDKGDGVVWSVVVDDGSRNGPNDGPGVRIL